jgi:general secretion pathway protein J
VSRACRRARGFTLIEVVIALALSSLVMLGRVSALASLGASARRIDARAGQSDRQWLTGEFLRAALSSMAGQIRYTRPDGSRSIYFHGEPQRVEWLGNMPARHGVGGIHHFRLLLEDDADAASGARLVLQYAPYVGNPDFDPAAISTHVLATGVDAFAIAYQSKPEREDEEAVWGDLWDDAERPPGRVRILIDAEGKAWPPLVTTLNAVDVATGSGVRVGGGYRR